MVSTLIPVTVIILTHNEAVNIASCAESLSAFAEIVVVDSGSTDGTLMILRDLFPSVRILENPFRDFGQQRNWALDHASASHEWILFLDADERATPAFAEAVRAVVASPGGHTGFFLCYRNFFLGRWIKRCTMYPTWQLRLLKAGQVRYGKEGHGQHEVMVGSAGYIREPYDHFGFSKGIKDWIARHNEYSSNEIQLIEKLASAPIRVSGLLSSDPVCRHRTLKALGARTPLRPVARFLYLYVIQLGFLDGRPGLLFCVLQVAHELHIVVKFAEARAAEPLSKPHTSTRALIAVPSRNRLRSRASSSVSTDVTPRQHS